MIGKNARVGDRLKAYEPCQVDYKVHKDKIPKLQDFKNVMNVDRLDKAEKMLSDANLLNEDDFNMALKKPPIKIKNN